LDLLLHARRHRSLAIGQTPVSSSFSSFPCSSVARPR
jgi:hypothetical protein